MKKVILVILAFIFISIEIISPASLAGYCLKTILVGGVISSYFVKSHISKPLGAVIL
jgi:hypothetical protein